MRKKTIFCLLILVFCNCIFAQKTKKKNIIGTDIGLSVPFSDFAIKKFSYKAGFAKTGINIEIDYYFYFSRFLALNANMGYVNLFFDDIKYRDAYNNLLSQTEGIRVDAGNYQVYKSLIGLVLKTPEIHGFELLIIPRSGYSYNLHPKLEVTDDDLGIINSVQKDQSGCIFGSVMARLNYYISEKYGIGFSYSRNRANSYFKDDTSYEHHFYLPINYQNFNIGLTVCL